MQLLILQYQTFKVINWLIHRVKITESSYLIMSLHVFYLNISIHAIYFQNHANVFQNIDSQLGCLFFSTNSDIFRYILFDFDH